MHLDIYSDTICPWCLIGKRRLEKALAEHPQEGLTIRWHPFQLNPDMPKDGMDRQTYLETKFGGPQRAAQVYGMIEDAGRTEGIDFQFQKIKTTANTVDSHRLLHFADQNGGQAAQDTVAEALFQAYFLDGKDLGDHEVLVAAGVQAGLDEQALRGYLASDQDAADIQARDQSARQLGIQGVPFFVVDNTVAMSGAQPPEAFHRLFAKAKEMAAEAAE